MTLGGDNDLRILENDLMKRRREGFPINTAVEDWQ